MLGCWDHSPFISSENWWEIASTLLSFWAEVPCTFRKFRWKKHITYLGFLYFMLNRKSTLRGHRIIFLTYVFTRLHSVSCLDSIFIGILAKFYTFNLSPHPSPLGFRFIFFSIWFLSLTLNFTSCQVGPNFLVICSLACIHF